jgi:hypothetical protein
VEALLVEKIANEEDGRVIVMMLPCGVTEEQGTVHLLPGTPELCSENRIATAGSCDLSSGGSRRGDFLQAGRN